MPRPSVAQVRERLATSFTLDHLWRETMGLPKGDSKEPALAELTDLLRRAHTPYALISGVAIQIYSAEPRTRADIDVALASYDDLPRGPLEAAGFTFERTFAHSENWRAPGGQSRKLRTAVQFTVDKLTPATVERAAVFRVRGMRFKVATPSDLVRLKLEAAAPDAVRKVCEREGLPPAWRA